VLTTFVVVVMCRVRRDTFGFCNWTLLVCLCTIQ